MPTFHMFHLYVAEKRLRPRVGEDGAGLSYTMVFLWVQGTRVRGTRVLFAQCGRGRTWVQVLGSNPGAAEKDPGVVRDGGCGCV